MLVAFLVSNSTTEKKNPTKNKPAEYTDLCVSCHLVAPILLGRQVSLAACFLSCS